MLIQAIDFLHLYQNHDCKIQFGGSDQWGNITTGLELIRKIEGDKASAVGLSSPLLLKADGAKFGKSESGALWLDSELTSPYEVYQYFINASDQDVVNYLKTLTLLDKQDILDLEDKLKNHPELRAAQKTLASEVTKLVHGQKALDEALRVTDALFSGEFSDLTESEFKMIAKTLDTLTLNESLNLVDLLVETKLAQSKREARQFISSNAVSVNGEKISDVEYELNKGNSYFDQYVMIRRGKKKYALVVMK
jgi:tyrosyl-tRNA synthetase